MDRKGPYLPIDTKINCIGVRFGKSREGTTPSWLDVSQKIAWLDEVNIESVQINVQCI